MTYWYFRLNGFFLLQNYVLHNIGEGEERGTADSDLLAIRFPYVYEEIGGQSNDWDREKFSEWGFDIEKVNLALIVEVKSGENVKRSEIEKSFSSKRLKTALYRFGIFPRDDVQRIHENLVEQKYVKESSWIIAKVLVTEKTREIKKTWLDLSLDEIDKFIHKRIRSYLHDKYADRTYFTSILIQYIAWKNKNRILNDW
ncbi:hypothetical protein [Thermoanaerobacter sp. RKWS2]|uniref:hypothetical protein n=1 Tax=Thermoanaerobacter sp. RKWS2 TaxID=2983842 RepID=UPI00224ADBA7|nr:hypothetical protein [Thermoanaerobacter sp. RKWS2]UZQ83665.1 hypothetical protein OEI98_000776 [Thermoanaerobacter sp. RKWS2]